MPRESVCIKVSKTYGEKAIVLLKKQGLFNRQLEIQRDVGSIYIPLTRQPTDNETRMFDDEFSGWEVLTQVFEERKKPATTFVEFLSEKLSPHEVASLPKAIDFVGDIAIIEVPPELETYKRVIGEAILQTHKSVKTVLAKAGAVSGVFRLREFSVIAGIPKTETVHKEYGCEYYVDIAKAYFSPRLSHEHHRVASLVREDEAVVDLFAGVGPFAVLIAKNHERVRVYAVDVNPAAVEFLKKNVRLNRVEGKVYPILGDARQVIAERFLGLADRVIMNLPERAMEFVGVACKALKPNGGIVHFYGFVGASDSLKDLGRRFREAVEQSGREVKAVPHSRFVRATAPCEWQAVLDAEVR